MPEALPPDADESDRRTAAEGYVHPEVKFEQADIKVSSIVFVLMGFALVFAGMSGISWWLLRVNESDADRAAQAQQYGIPADELPTAPRLEPLDRIVTTTPTNVFAKQLAMERVLHSYGNAADEGFVHIPIEEAMKLAAESLSVRQQPATEPAKGFGLVGGGESSSGRLYLEAPSWLQQKK